MINKNLPKKVIIFDSGPLISFALTGLLDEIRKLKKTFNGSFIIPKEVKAEIIDYPLTIKRFELEALQIKSLLEDGTLELPDSIGISSQKVSSDLKGLMEKANNLFYNSGKSLKIIHLGESACLALSKILSDAGVENVIGLDERTTRVLVERPENLKKLLERKLHTKIEQRVSSSGLFEGFKIIRSTELIYIAYKKGLINLKGENVLEALLFAMKFKGTAVSYEEIKRIEKL